MRQSMMDSSLSSLTSSMQDRERVLAAELLKHRAPTFAQEQQLAAAMALASRNQVPQDTHENLILKRAINQLSGMYSGNPSQSSQQESHHSRGNNSVYCAEQDLSLEKDICFGRGQRVQRRKANVAFRKIVATHQETYDKAESREDKKFVVKKVARIFSRAGFRFFKETEEPARFGNGSKLWVAVSDHHVEYKIGHSFRSGRKQLKQQKNQQKEKEDTDADTSIDVSNEVKPKTSQSKSIASVPSKTTVPENPSDHSVYKEEELSEKCICIGDKREKYTGMEAYQYFRGFILTFKSILGMTESVAEKTKIVSGLIEQMKATKGFKFLKLMQLKKDVEFWVEASPEEISSEVFSIVGVEAKSNNEKKVPSAEQTTLKRLSSASEGPPKKRHCVSPDSVRHDALKRIVSDSASTLKDDKKKLDVASSSSSSTVTQKEKFVWKKGRKRTLPEGFKKHGFVPSEIICKPNIEQTDRAASKGSDVSKVEREAMSAMAAQGVRIPPSLVSPDVLLGKVPFGNSSTGALERSLKMMRGTSEKTAMGKGGFTQNFPGQSILEKALLAMQPSSIQRARERSIGENTNLTVANELEMKGKLLQHLRQQELLYLEKKHKLAMLELQLQARNGV